MRVQSCETNNCWRVILLGLWIWCGERPLRKLATKFFCFSVLIWGACLNVYLLSIITESKDCLFLYTREKCVLYCIVYRFSFLIYQFPWNVSSFANKKMVDFLSVEHHGAPWMDLVDRSWNRALCYKLPAPNKVFHLLLKC